MQFIFIYKYYVCSKFVEGFLWHFYCSYNLLFHDAITIAGFCIIVIQPGSNFSAGVSQKSPQIAFSKTSFSQPASIFSQDKVASPLSVSVQPIFLCLFLNQQPSLSISYQSVINIVRFA